MEQERIQPWAWLRPSPESLWHGEDCLSEASSAALVFGTGAKGPVGPRPGGNGLGLLPKQKDLVVWGETQQLHPFFRTRIRNGVPSNPNVARS